VTSASPYAFAPSSLASRRATSPLKPVSTNRGQGQSLRCSPSRLMSCRLPVREESLRGMPVMGHDPCQRGGQAFIEQSWWAELVLASLRNGQIPGSAHRSRRQDDSRATSRWKIPTPACQSVPDQPRKQLQAIQSDQRAIRGSVRPSLVPSSYASPADIHTSVSFLERYLASRRFLEGKRTVSSTWSVR
jgi:hypothetical protein